MYEVKLETFQGPLDLLLHLIQKNEMDIYDIPIAEITRQYLEYLDLMKALDLEVASEFLVMAATLLQIKSRSMLPAPAPEEIEFVEGAREELVRQLLEYKRFKEAAEKLRALEMEREKIFFREVDRRELENKEYAIEASLFDLLSALRDVLSRFPDEPMEISEEDITVEDKMDQIMTLLSEREELSFNRIFSELASKREVIVTFLAILELIRIHRLIAYQTTMFGDIILRKRKADDDGGA
ncbi:segregation/condensation protein A [Candidatus Poribacteria bacterium]|nr:segregation/condensation protein A [Candidatus Poribacteria bacterium]